MVKITFTNAVAKDTGYGLEVNGKSLEEIISTALGTRKGSNYGYGSGLPSFESNCCNISITIDPQPKVEEFVMDDIICNSMEMLMEDVVDECKQETKEADPEE